MSENVKPTEGTLIRIKDGDEVLELEYDGAMTAHRGSLWWGTAVGFRAMQVAAGALSQNGELWSRDNIYIVGAHAGEGIRDSINYVTKAYDNGRFNVQVDEGCEMRCNSSMKFEWWVSDGKKTALVQLRKDFVPAAFYQLADRLSTPQETEEDRKAFDIFKVNLASRIWNAPLEASFSVKVTDQPLEPGTLPGEMTTGHYWDDMEDIRVHKA